jgi:hypothetical protein
LPSKYPKSNPIPTSPDMWFLLYRLQAIYFIIVLMTKIRIIHSFAETGYLVFSFMLPWDGKIFVCLACTVCTFLHIYEKISNAIYCLRKRMNFLSTYVAAPTILMLQVAFWDLCYFWCVLCKD